ncbi:MAG: quinone oxidoreductase [Planctomycetes bacterium]|nr:quinone oxidoreductase [Planctomycetota bacterium]
MGLVVRVHQPGPADSLRCDEVVCGRPARGEVRLRQTAIGVNFLDVYHRSGLYPLPSLPHGIGAEAVGVVTDLGEGVVGLRVGDRMGYAAGLPPGSYAEERNVPAWRLVHLPDAVPDDVVTASLLKGLTAEYLLRRTFKVGPGHRVLVHAAAGGVGLILCQWLRHLGATTLGVVSTDGKAAAAKAAGCTYPIVAPDGEFAAVVRERTQGKGVDVVYDSVGKVTQRDSLASLRPRGMLVLFGNASGRPDPIDPAELQRRGSLFVTRPVLNDYVATRQELLRAARSWFGALTAGVVRPVIDRRLPLADAAAAHRLLEARATTGSLVLLP